MNHWPLHQMYMSEFLFYVNYNDDITLQHKNENFSHKNKEGNGNISKMPYQNESFENFFSYMAIFIKCAY